MRRAIVTAASWVALLACVAVAAGAPTPRRVRLLVFSPHPDDAALAAAGYMQRVAAAHGEVHIVQMTSGDAFSKGVVEAARESRPRAEDYRQYGELRESEALAAARAIGLPRSAVTFLGFPDDGLCALASTLGLQGAFVSPYTKRQSPPRGEQVVRGAMYRGDDVRREMASVIEAFKPTVVLMPDARDEHPDHCATHLFVHQAIDSVVSAGRLRAPRVLHYLIHYGQWPARTSSARLGPPARFPAGDGVWLSWRLTPQESARKKRALAAYSTQRLIIGDFMAAFDREDELFLEGEPTSVAACWCAGEDITRPAAGHDVPRSSKAK